jgi:anti-sigma factor RsiW
MTHPARFDLDRLAAGELDDAVAEPLRAHAEGCEACRAYLAGLERDRTTLLARRPAAAFAVAIEERILAGDPRPVPVRRWVWAWGLGGVVAVAALLVIALRVPNDPGGTGSGRGVDTRWMGAPAVVRVHVLRDGVTSLLEGAPRPGDRLRWEVSLPPGIRGHVAVIGVEGARAFPVLPPGAAEDAFPLDGSGLLPGSVEVDAAGPATRLLLVVRAQPFRAGDLAEEAARSLGNAAEILPGTAAELSTAGGPP